MRNLTASVLNINEAGLTINVLERLTCLAPQDWAVQVILVDNGSRPDQLRCLSDWCVANRERFGEMLFLAASRNLGGNGGHNVSFKLASGDRILLLDNDVVLPEDSAWLDSLWKQMDDHTYAGIVAPLLVFAGYPHIVQGAGIGLTERGRVGYLERGRPVDRIPTSPVEVVAAPSTCWLVRREAQQAVGLFADEFYPMQYWDVDFCVRLGEAGWKIICERSVRIKHIENVTTRNLRDHPYARVSVRHWMRFREKWADVLPRIATIGEDDIYWGPIPREQA